MQFLKQAMILAGAALLALPAAAQIRPAGYTDGFVRQVDPRARTLTVGNETYQVNRNTTTSIYEVHPGSWKRVTEEGGRPLGTVREVLPNIANDVLELDTGVLLPLVEDCILEVDVAGRRIVVAPGYAEPD